MNDAAHGLLDDRDEDGTQFTDYRVSELMGMLNPDHPKSSTKNQRQSLAGSLKKFTQVVPLVINETTGQVISGHQTVLAANEAGMRTLSAITVRMSPEEQDAFTIALGTTRGDWNEEKLTGLLLVIQADARKVTGIPDREFQRLVNLYTDEHVEPQAVDVDAIKAEAEAPVKHTYSISFGDLKLTLSAEEYNAWITRMRNNTRNATAQSIGREVAKRIGVKHLING